MRRLAMMTFAVTVWAECDRVLYCVSASILEHLNVMNF